MELADGLKDSLKKHLGCSVFSVEFVWTTMRWFGWLSINLALIGCLKHRYATSVWHTYVICSYCAISPNVSPIESSVSANLPLCSSSRLAFIA